MIIQLQPGVRLNLIQTNKFKEITCSINFLSELTEENATQRSILALMLNDRTNKYETKQKLTAVLDHLYGATMACRSVGYGRCHVVEIRSKIINPSYVTQSNHLLNDWMDLLREVILHPLMKDNELDENVYKEAKDMLKDKLVRRNDDAQTYSILQAFALAGKDQPLSISARGTIECLDKQTCLDITKAYCSMIEQDQIDIVICGDFDEQQMVKRVLYTFNFKPRTATLDAAYTLKTKEMNKLTEEEKNQPQTNLALVYTTGILPTDKLFPALKVANGILGQYPTSYLFQTIREKHSLCYSIYSNLISYDGVCAITTGIERENLDTTMQLIEEQINKCKKEEYSDELIQITKSMLINALQSSLDEASSLIGYAYSNMLLNREYSIDENIQAVKQVTREDLKAVFDKLTYVTGFVLSGKEKSNESNS